MGQQIGSQQNMQLDLKFKTEQAPLTSLSIHLLQRLCNV